MAAPAKPAGRREEHEELSNEDAEEGAMVASRGRHPPKPKGLAGTKIMGAEEFQ